MSVTGDRFPDEESVVHYARDEDQQPLCEDGSEGDWMTFFAAEVTCGHCKAALR